MDDPRLLLPTRPADPVLIGWTLWCHNTWCCYERNDWDKTKTRNDFKLFGDDLERCPNCTWPLNLRPIYDGLAPTRELDCERFLAYCCTRYPR